MGIKARENKKGEREKEEKKEEREGKRRGRRQKGRRQGGRVGGGPGPTEPTQVHMRNLLPGEEKTGLCPRAVSGRGWPNLRLRGARGNKKAPPL